MKKTLIFLFLSLLSLSFSSCDSEKDAAIDKITDQIANINAECPIQIDEVTMWTKCSIEDPYFVYTYVIDEDQFEDDFDFTALFEESNAEFKDALTSSLKEAVNLDETKETLIKAGLGVRYHYIGTNSNKTYDFDFSPEEIAAM